MLLACENRVPIEILEEGIYLAVCSQVIDLGYQSVPAFNKVVHKVRIVWEIPDKVIKIKDEEYPRRLSRDFTLSLSENSNLRKTLQQWRGKTFTKEELQGFQMHKLLGVGAQIQVMHKEGRNGIYANVETVLPFPKGAELPQVQTIYFELKDKTTHFAFPLLSNGLKKIISGAQNFQESGLVVEGAASGEKPSRDTLPEGKFHDLPSDGLPYSDDLPF